jgi:hypothetical protein
MMNDAELTNEPRPPRQFVAKIAFEDGRETAPFPIGAYDFHGALAKLAGVASDQRGKIIAVQLVRQALPSEVLAEGAMPGPDGKAIKFLPWRAAKRGQP